MLGYDPYRSSKIFDSINAIAGKNKELVKEWLLTQPISKESKYRPFPKDYADRLALLNKLYISKTPMIKDGKEIYIEPARAETIQFKIRDILYWPDIGDNGDHESITDKYADKLASLIMATHYTVSEAIINEFIFYCESGINPERSPSFRHKMLSKGIPAHAHTLQEKASDLSLRASSTKHKVKEDLPKDSEMGF